MLHRTENWFECFKISKSASDNAIDLAEAALEASVGMMASQDFHALAAALLHHKPALIFEIGT